MLGCIWTCTGFLIYIAKWLPVLFTLSIGVWSTHAYVFKFVFLQTESLVEQILYVVSFLVLGSLLAWSYLQTVFKPQTDIPAKFTLLSEVTQDLLTASSDHLKDEIILLYVIRNDLPVALRTDSGKIRYCDECKIIKPDRCHHCRSCGKCVLLMDHHCPWINNCVSFANQKFFVLFLGYLFVWSTYVGLTTLPLFLDLFSGNDSKRIISNSTETSTSVLPSGETIIYSMTEFDIMLLFIISTTSSLMALILFSLHIYLLLNNRTTLEMISTPMMKYGADSSAFNLGYRKNLSKSLGKSKLLWFIPIFTTEGDGATFELRRRTETTGDVEAGRPLNSHSSDTNPRVTQSAEKPR